MIAGSTPAGGRGPGAGGVVGTGGPFLVGAGLATLGRSQSGGRCATIVPGFSTPMPRSRAGRSRRRGAAAPGRSTVTDDARRLMAVHAHPDDESSKGAATMARYATEGARVRVVTCTGGERGDILNPKLA